MTFPSYNNSFSHSFPFDFSVSAVGIRASLKHELIYNFLPSDLQNQKVEYGYHPWRQSRLGLGAPTRHTWVQFHHGPPADKYIDWVPYTGREKFDLCMRYEYEVPTEFYSPISSEYLILPVTEVLYRRDPLLSWSEIKRYLIAGQLPRRYHEPGTGPMSKDWFISSCSRFYLNNDTLYERSTRCEVVTASHDFEVTCMMLDCDWNRLQATVLLEMIQQRVKGWYVDGLARARWFLEDPMQYSVPLLLDSTDELGSSVTIPGRNR